MVQPAEIASERDAGGVGHEDRVTMQRVSWSAYEQLLVARGDGVRPRLTFLEGELELMSPSRDHERIGACLGMLIMVFAEEREIALSPYGAWTVRSRDRSAGLEPDLCFIAGADHAKDRPDLAVEVTLTHGGIAKLDVYRRLQVPEVWFWRNDQLSVHVLDGADYRASARSQALPGLDLARLAELVRDAPLSPSTTDVLRAYRAELRLS